MEIRIHRTIGEIQAADWDALLDDTATPFVRYAWLHSLELSGSACAQTGWRPAHVTLHQGARLVAALPLYLKDDSDGDFSRDWGWAEAAHAAHIPYYPKLVATVPFTPVTGARLLIARGEDRESCAAQLITGAKQVAKESGAQSLHVLFPAKSEISQLATLGLQPRVDIQFHFVNEGYQNFDDFVSRFRSKQRNQIHREVAAMTKNEIEVRTLRGDELEREHGKWAQAAYELHRLTVEKWMWGRHWLTRGFYEQIFTRMIDALEMVVATRHGRLIAGAFNVSSPSRLYGRYWGCHEEHPFLHFNVCQYHSIKDCIERGLQVFEGGAGGEHKLARGFEPAETHSAHLFFDARLKKPLGAYLERESRERSLALQNWRAKSPILKPKQEVRK